MDTNVFNNKYRSTLCKQRSRRLVFFDRIEILKYYNVFNNKYFCLIIFLTEQRMLNDYLAKK
jgi:hypothetical protein